MNERAIRFASCCLRTRIVASSNYFSFGVVDGVGVTCKPKEGV